jgi:hypothetical protein
VSVLGFRKLIKIARNLRGVGNPIWNIVHFGKFLVISIDFELFKEFWVHVIGLNCGQIG